MRLARVRVGHRTDGRVLVRVPVLRVPGIGTLWLRGQLSPDDARTVARALIGAAELAQYSRVTAAPVEAPRG